MFLKYYVNNYFSYIYIYLLYFKLFFILVLFYFIKNNYLIAIIFTINNYFIFFIIEKLIFLIIRKYYVVIKKLKIKKGVIMGHVGEAGPSLNGLEVYLGRPVDPNSICATILECLALKKYWPKWADPPGRAHYPSSTCYYFFPLSPCFNFHLK